MLDDVHDAAELHKQLPEHSEAAYHDETFWELPMPEFIADLEHLADEGEFRLH